MTLMEDLKAFRMSRGFSTAEVGRIMGVTRPAVWIFENSENPQLQTILRYVAAIGAELTVVPRAIPNGGLRVKASAYASGDPYEGVLLPREDGEPRAILTDDGRHVYIDRILGTVEDS